MMVSSNPIIVLLYSIPVVLISLSFHELAHALVSYRLGDPTAKNKGRITLDPRKHLDPLGTIMIVVSSLQGMGFGWAKPVPINAMYYKDRKKGTMLVSLAGPLSNVLLAFLFSIPKLYTEMRYGIPEVLITQSFQPVIILHNLSQMFFVINLSLAIFNMIPVPPLDGSKVLSVLLPARQYYKMMEYENYIGVIFLLVIFVFPSQFYAVLTPFVESLATAIILVVKPMINMLI